MDTPICDFAKQYADRDTLRLHMPGHKGIGGEAERLDLTEIDGADVLYHSQGIIRASEENAASLFGTAKTVYSTEGSPLGIRARLYLAMLYGKQQGRSPKLLAGRNAHKTFMTGAALLDLEVQWLAPQEKESILSCKITPENLEEALSATEDKPIGVYLTNPDYLGNMIDIGSLAEICHRHGVLLLVDNAHGAYLRFLPRSLHPMDLGADLCCDSAHKTLPVLTGGAYLHISKTAPTFFREHAELAMSLFASTSPSYLILESLDRANRYLATDYAAKLAFFSHEVTHMKMRLQTKGFDLIGNEALKLTVAPKSYGYTGSELAAHLEKESIICEFSDPDYVVMMLTPEPGIDALNKLEAVLLSTEKRDPIRNRAPAISPTDQKLSMREALFSPSEELPLGACRGRILASASITCPPAIPILICGEEITVEAIACMEYYGITACRVVDTTGAFRRKTPQ